MRIWNNENKAGITNIDEYLDIDFDIFRYCSDKLIAIVLA